MGVGLSYERGTPVPDGPVARDPSDGGTDTSNDSNAQANGSNVSEPAQHVVRRERCAPQIMCSHYLRATKLCFAPKLTDLYRKHSMSTCKESVSCTRPFRWRCRHLPRKVDERLPGKGNSTSHGARPDHLIITIIWWIRTIRLSIKNSLYQLKTLNARKVEYRKGSSTMSSLSADHSRNLKPQTREIQQSVSLEYEPSLGPRNSTRNLACTIGGVPQRLVDNVVPLDGSPPTWRHLVRLCCL